MIDIIKNNDNFLFVIGKHSFKLNPKIIKQLSTTLNQEWINKAAAGDTSWEMDSWKIEYAEDDKANMHMKTESRERLLLWVGDLKWHILKEEALKIGDLCRSLNLVI